MAEEYNTSWEWNGHTYVLDLDDVEDYERYVAACDGLGKEGEQSKAEGRDAASLRQYCDAFYRFFDGLLGEGAAAELFDGKRKGRLCEAAYLNLMDFCGKQVEHINRVRMTRRGGAQGEIPQAAPPEAGVAPAPGLTPEQRRQLLELLARE